MRGSGEYGQEDGIAGARDERSFGLHCHLAFCPTLTPLVFPFLGMVSPRFTGRARRPVWCRRHWRGRRRRREGFAGPTDCCFFVDWLRRHFQYAGPLPVCYPLHGSTGSVGFGQSRQLFDRGAGCCHLLYRVNIARHSGVNLLALAVCGYRRIAPDLAGLASGEYPGRREAGHYLWCG